MDIFKPKHANLKCTGNFSGLKKDRHQKTDLTHHGDEVYNKSIKSKSLIQFQKGIHSGQLQHNNLKGGIKYLF